MERNLKLEPGADKKFKSATDRRQKLRKMGKKCRTPTASLRGPLVGLTRIKQSNTIAFVQFRSNKNNDKICYYMTNSYGLDFEKFDWLIAESVNSIWPGKSHTRQG